MQNRKFQIAMSTGGKSDWGILKNLAMEIKNHNAMNLTILASAGHHSPVLGETISQVMESSIPYHSIVSMVDGDLPTSIAKSAGLTMLGIADYFHSNYCDALIVLGDRWEALATAIVAHMFKIPIVHLHGGEITHGAYDDAFRHSLTKLSSLHFPATLESAERIVKMGEHPNNVFNFGAIGLDGIDEVEPMFNGMDAIVSFHPETAGPGTFMISEKIVRLLIEEFEMSVLVSIPSADVDYYRHMINNEYDGRLFILRSQDRGTYLRYLKSARIIVGNSSSGIIEAPSLGTLTVNIGRRQGGREACESVYHCDDKLSDIKESIRHVLDWNIENIDWSKIQNPYLWRGTAAKDIASVLYSSLKNKKISPFNMKGFRDES